MKFLFVLLLIPVLSSCTKFCVNCKYFIPKQSIFLFPDYNSPFGKCGFYPDKIINNDFLVTGKPKSVKVDYYYCSTARSYDHMCGDVGKHFVKKDTTIN